MSCTFLKKDLVEDKYPWASDAGYYSALFKDSSNNFHFGLFAHQSLDSSGLFLFEVFGIYKGTISIKSESCNINELIYYNESGFNKISLNIKDDRCLLNVYINPEFDTSKKYSGLSGLILFKKDNSFFSNIYSDQLKRKSFRTISFNLESANNRLFIFSCSDNINHKNKTGSLSIFISRHDSDICIIEGFIKEPLSDTLILGLFTFHANDYQRLALPKLNQSGFRVSIYATDSVSHISAINLSFFSNRAHVSAHFPILISLYSNKGRAAYCIYQSEMEKKCFH